jgi:predicted SAM-dependent methyltransferase
MLRYIAAAAMLKMFSNSLTKKLYRRLGNEFGNKKRLNSSIPDSYINRIKRLLSLSKKYNIVRDGDQLLEIGTGWVHWEALSLKLFFDIKATLYDIWDNRQFDALKKYCLDFSQLLDGEIDFDPERKDRAHHLIKRILLLNSFEQLYDLLDFKYIVDPKGNISCFKNESFDVVISAGVLEHIDRKLIAECIKRIYLILKPGGYSIHSISMADHLSFFDKNTHPKKYMQFSDRIWKFCFENHVQYFNRIQKSEWLSLFNESGLKLIEERSARGHLSKVSSKVRLNKKYRNMDEDDLWCIHLSILHVRAPS